MSRRKRVLIVDDDQDNREAYAEYLRYRGFSVREAETGAAAVELVGRWDPDIVVLDMRLPDTSGAETSREVRKMRGSQPTIIALSACVFEGDIALALKSGCDAFLAKPCLPDLLESEIRRLLHMRAVA